MSKSLSVGDLIKALSEVDPHLIVYLNEDCEPAHDIEVGKAEVTPGTEEVTEDPDTGAVFVSYHCADLVWIGTEPTQCDFIPGLLIT